MSDIERGGGFKIHFPGGAWVVLSIKHPTLDLGSGRDLTVPGFEPRVGLCIDSAEPAWDSLSVSLCLSLSLSLSLSVCQNK